MVQVCKRDYELFEPNSMQFPINKFMFGQFECVANLELYGFRFKQKRNAVRFAVWASAMATSRLEKGYIATINLLFD